MGAIEDYLNSLGGQGYAPETEISRGRVTSPFMEGLRHSVSGLMLGSEPDLSYAPQNFWDRVQMGAGTMMGDFPAMVAGGAAGAVAGPVGAGVGAMALPEAARQTLMAGRFGTEFNAGEIAKAGLIGGVTGGVGRVVPGLMRLPAELGAMTATQAAVEGQLPTPGDIAANAILMGGMHVAAKGFSRSLQNQGRSIAVNSAMKRLREELGVQDEIIKLGAESPLGSEIYPAVQTQVGKIYFDPSLKTHGDLTAKVQDRVWSYKRGGLGAQVRKEQAIANGYVADGEFYPTIELAQEAIGRAREKNPPVPEFTAEFDAKLPELSALVSPEYLAKANGFSWRPDRPNPTEGFLVGGKIVPDVIPDGAYTADKAIGFATQHRDRLANNPRLFVGGWKDKGVNKNVYLDLAEHVMDRQEAIDLAFQRGEQRIFDLKTGLDIPISEQLVSSKKPAFDKMRAELEKKLGPSKIFEPQATQWEKMVDKGWDKYVVGKVFPFMEKLPGRINGTQWFTGVRRLFEPGFRGNLLEGDLVNQALKQSKIMRATGAEAGIDIGNRLAALPEVDRGILGKVIRGEERFEKLPEHLKPVGNEVIDIFYALGKRATDLGMMDPKVFFEHVGQYLPRYYSAFEYAENLKKLGIKAPGEIEIKRFLQKKELPEEWRTKMGEITDPSYAAAKGIIEESQSIAFGEFAKFVASNHDWALSPEKAFTLGKAIPADWVQLSDSRRHGFLASKWVHPEIARELEVSLKSKDEAIKMAEKLYGIWKAGKVVTSPKTFIRNAFSNAVLAHLGGMPLWEQTYYLPRAMQEMRKKGTFYQALKQKTASTSTNFVKAELQGIASQVPELANLPGAPKQGFLKKAGTKVIDWAGEKYQQEEILFKLAKMMHSVERRGMDITSAARDAEKWLFDYSDVTKFQNRYRSALYGAPFATFTFKSIPRVVEAAAKTPWRFFAPMMMLNAVEEYAREKFGDTVKNEDGKKKLRDEWMQGKMLGISNFPRVPIMDDFGREYYLDLTYILPWGDIAQSGGVGGQIAGQSVGLPGALMPFTHPVASQLWQQISNYNSFTKKEIVKESELVGRDLSSRIAKTLEARAGFAAKSLAPTALVDAVKVIRGDYNAMDYRGREKPTGVKLADALVGLKMYPVDYADQMQRNLAKLDPARGKIAQEIRSRIRANSIRKRVLEDRGQNYEHYERLIRDDIEQLHGLALELRDKAEAFRSARDK